jgi:hypothetical protein
MAKFWFLALALTFSTSALAGFVKGFNQGWMHDHYGSQWNDGVFDEAESRRLLRLTREGGGEVLRIWLFEGFSFNKANLDNVDLMNEMNHAVNAGWFDGKWVGARNFVRI